MVNFSVSRSLLNGLRPPLITFEGGRLIMKKNVGGIDKAIRFIIGIILGLVGFFVHMGTGLRIGAFVVAAVALVTAFTGF
jgi:Inner membrane protein YgaP-like, transmembrane domain